MKRIQQISQRIAVWACSVFISVCTIGAIGAKWIMPYDPNAVRLTEKLLPPSFKYWLGTDHLGRDIFSRLLAGLQISFGLVLGVFLISVLVGVAVGMLSGYIGGWIDQGLMRLCDAILAFPNMVLVLGIVGMLGPGIYQIVIALLLVQWVYYAKMVRDLVVHIRVEPYLQAAYISGSGRFKQLRKHIFPQILPQITVIATLEMGWAIMDISALSFLGLGIQPPTAEWGAMINEGRGYLRQHPALLIFPGLCILLVVSAFNILGESLSKSFGVKKGRRVVLEDLPGTSNETGLR